MYVIGRNIRVLRKDCGMTQEELAKRIGVSKATISNYENNITKPSLKYLVRLADAFGIEVRVLFEGTVPSKEFGDDSVYSENESMKLSGDIPYAYIYTDEDGDAVIYINEQVMLFEEFSGGCIFTEIDGKICMVDTNSDEESQFMCGNCRIGKIVGY